MNDCIFSIYGYNKALFIIFSANEEIFTFDLNSINFFCWTTKNESTSFRYSSNDSLNDLFKISSFFSKFKKTSIRKLFFEAPLPIKTRDSSKSRLFNLIYILSFFSRITYWNSGCKKKLYKPELIESNFIWKKPFSSIEDSFKMSSSLFKIILSADLFKIFPPKKIGWFSFLQEIKRKIKKRKINLINIKIV